MNAYVIVEGPADAALLSRLLPLHLARQTAIVAAGGRGNLASKARTILVTRRLPVAVLADADSIDKSAVAERRQLLEELLRTVAGGVPFQVLMVEPEIEAVLFGVPAAVERVVGRALSADEMLLTRYQPKEVLRRLSHEQGVPSDQIVNRLLADEMDAIREASPMKELIDFLAEQILLQAQPQTA